MEPPTDELQVKSEGQIVISGSKSPLPPRVFSSGNPVSCCFLTVLSWLSWTIKQQATNKFPLV